MASRAPRWVVLVAVYIGLGTLIGLGRFWVFGAILVAAAVYLTVAADPTLADERRHPGGPTVDRLSLRAIRLSAAALFIVAFTDIGLLPGANQAYANAINESDVICGYSYSSVTGVPYSAYKWQNGQTTALNLPGNPPLSVANDIADDGSICGWMGDGNYTTGRGFIWKNGKTVEVGIVLPGAIGTDLRGITTTKPFVASACSRIPTAIFFVHACGEMAMPLT